MSNNHKHIDVLFSITFNYMARKKQYIRTTVL